MSETWYRMTMWARFPTELEIVKSTDKSVFHTNGRREAIDSDGMAIRRTQKECWDWYLKALQARLEAAQREVQSAEVRLSEARQKVKELGMDY